MIKMCLYLKGSQFKSIKEVEYILFNDWYKVPEEEVIEMKDNREKIEATLKLIEDYHYIDDLGI